MLVKIADIKVKHRVRKDLGDLDSLKDSLRIYGLMNPITLNSKYELIAGERRLEAAKAIGWTSINANVLSDIDEVSQLEMEIEENNQRKEFTDTELIAGYNRLARLRNPGLFYRLMRRIKAFFKRFGEAIHHLFSR